MINFHNIRWKNFLSTGNNWTSIDLDRNANTLILGENGSGKSTVLDALTFGLFGKPFRKINKPQLINSINDGECLVEINFTIGNNRYFIRRGIKPTVFDIELNGIQLDKTAHAKDFQEILENQILKLNYKSFTQVVVLGSSTFVPFMQLPAAYRREVIEDLLDIQIFSLMNSILRQKSSVIKGDLNQNQNEISLKQQLIEVQQKNLDQIKKGNIEIIEKHQKDIQKHSSENTKRSEEIFEHNFLIKSLNLKLMGANRHSIKLKEAEQIDNKLYSKESTLTHEIEFYDDHDECPTCQQDIDANFKKATLKEKKTKMVEVVRARKAISKLINEINKEIEIDQTAAEDMSNIHSKVSSLETNILATKQIIKSLEESIENLSTKEDVNNTEKQIEDAKTILCQLESNKKELIDQKEIQKIASSLLKDSGIKTLIIKQYLPIMNTLINRHLASMDFFVNFNLDENFDETIKSRHRDEFSYESFSEGEKMRIDLALLFTWRAIARLKNSTNTNLLILDEVFDSSLDDAGTQEFLKILYTLGKDQNVFVISHKGDVLQDKFNNIIKFEKIKGFSRIT